jgi:sterol 3beta-glucosyltransferase
MNIVIMTVGTHGDVQPFVALALGLSGRGHRVTLAAPPNVRHFIESRGIDFREMGVDVQAIMAMPDIARRAENATPLKFMRFRKRFAGELFLKAGRDARELFREADLVIYKTPLKIAFCLSRLTGVPAVEVGLVPMLPTTHDTGVVLAARNFGGPVNRLVAGLLHQVVWRGCRESIEALRAEIPELKPYRAYKKMARATLHADPVIYTFSPRIYPKPADWGDNVPLTGYWFLPADPSWSPTAELTAFLASGDQPVYFGFGSMTNADPDRALRLIVETIERLGVRGVVSSGWADFARRTAHSTRVMFIGYVPHDWLFPRMAAVVHHGGAGTTAAALRAGVPSVLVPHLGDQAMWGRLLFKLGVAPRPIPMRRLDGRRLERALREALAEGRMRERASETAAALAAEDGVERAVEVIESFMASRQR